MLRLALSGQRREKLQATCGHLSPLSSLFCRWSPLSCPAPARSPSHGIAGLPNVVLHGLPFLCETRKGQAPPSTGCSQCWQPWGHQSIPDTSWGSLPSSCERGCPFSEPLSSQRQNRGRTSSSSFPASFALLGCLCFVSLSWPACCPAPCGLDTQLAVPSGFSLEQQQVLSPAGWMAERGS